MKNQSNNIGITISLALGICLLMSITSVSAITDDTLYITAERLQTLGIIKDIEADSYLDGIPNRAEAAVIMVRLLGKESLCQTVKFIHPFTDVPLWASNYVGYLYQEGLANGVSMHTYASSNQLSLQQFITMILRALEYNDKLGDFRWDNPIDKAQEIGLYTDNGDDTFSRSCITYILYNSLTAKLKNQNVTLIEKLLDENSISIDQIIKTGDENLIDLAYSKNILLKKLIVLVSDSYDESELSNVISRISNISRPILEGLVDSGVTVRLINSPITNDPNFSFLQGITPKGWEGTGKTWDDIPGAGGNPTIIRVGYSEKGRGHGTINLELHEIAHAVDGWVLDDISRSDYFKNIWKKEAKNLFKNNTYFNSYPEEYFAEVFAMYFLDELEKARIKNLAPKTYELLSSIEKCVNLDYLKLSS